MSYLALPVQPLRATAASSCEKGGADKPRPWPTLTYAGGQADRDQQSKQDHLRENNADAKIMHGVSRADWHRSVLQQSGQSVTRGRSVLKSIWSSMINWKTRHSITLSS